jgi:hypothetical protein
MFIHTNLVINLPLYFPVEEINRRMQSVPPFGSTLIEL